MLRIATLLFFLAVLVFAGTGQAQGVEPAAPEATATSVETPPAAAPAQSPAKQKKEKKAAWKILAGELGLARAGLASDILWGKIPAALQEAAGGKTRPKYFKWPVKGGRFGRGFGSGKDGRHKALDIVAPTGTPVMAAAAGLVVWANEKNGYGKTVIVVHPGGWVTLYAHLSKYLVEPGMKVASRQKIALVGNTGISRGPHLHFMFFDNGVLRDPAPLMHPSYPHPPHVPPQPFMSHTVKKGESAAAIADKYDLETTEELLEANGMKPGQGFLAGWKIIIPKKIGSKKKSDKGTYTVKKGDTLASIAVLYDVSIKELKTTNDIKDVAAIHPGMKLRIPEGAYEGKALAEPSASGGDEEETAPQEQDEAFESYVVKPGDSLFTIAKKHDTSIKKITEINQIKNPAMVKPGLKLLLPAAAKKKPEAVKAKKKKPETPFKPLTDEDMDITQVEHPAEEEP